MVGCFDTAYILKYDLKRVADNKIPITILTNSESLFEIMVKSITTTEKRLMIYVRAAREAFENREFLKLGWIRSMENAADELTKLKQCEALENLQLLELLTLK